MELSDIFLHILIQEDLEKGTKMYEALKRLKKEIRQKAVNKVERNFIL